MGERRGAGGTAGRGGHREDVALPLRLDVDDVLAQLVDVEPEALGHGLSRAWGLHEGRGGLDGPRRVAGVAEEPCVIRLAT